MFLGQGINEVTRNMGEIRVRRLPVVNRGKQLVGIIALEISRVPAPKMAQPMRCIRFHSRVDGLRRPTLDPPAAFASMRPVPAGWRGRGLS